MTFSVAWVLYGLVPGAPAASAFVLCGLTLPPAVLDGSVTLTFTLELPLPRTPLELVALPPRELVVFVFMLEPPPWLMAVDDVDDCALDVESAVCACAPIVVIANIAAHATLILLLFISLSGRGLSSTQATVLIPLNAFSFRCFPELLPAAAQLGPRAGRHALPLLGVRSADGTARRKRLLF
ncbi:uncharacterized protein BCN122_II2407 [Burkholderia cenocepacia]|nr:uncharacterized protein BCN122_II2407 [Burkholderia cenocepacia]